MRYFPKCPIFIILASLSLLPLEGAPSKNAADQPPAISDRQVLNYLSTADALEWERAQDELKLGKSLVETGTYLVNRPASPLMNSQEIELSKRSGQDQITRGQAMVTAAGEKLDALRAKAAEVKENTKVVKNDPVTIPMEYAPMSMQDALMPTVEKLLFSLWNQGYSRLYLDSTYVIDTAEKDPIYIADPLLTREVRGIIARLDGNRFTFVNDESVQFKLMQEGGRYYLDFPERELNLRNFKCALILAEVVYDSRLENALLSLRGIDLKSSVIVASELVSLVVDDSVRSLVPKTPAKATPKTDTAEGETATEEPEGEAAAVATNTETAAPTTSESAPDATSETTPESEKETLSAITKRLAVQLKDNNNFLARISASGTPYVFTVEYVGDVKGFSSRAASMISKIILLSQNLHVSDDDFLVLAMGQGESEPGTTENRNQASALWKVTPLGSGGQGRNAYDIQAVSLISSQPSSVPVGLMQTVMIQENAPVGGS